MMAAVGEEEDGEMQQPITSAAATVDRVSSMPDEILCRILSLVTTKEAVASSVLSKRWTHLWLSVPNLVFPSIRVNDIESNSRLIESVYSVLLSREANGSNFINTFQLCVQYGHPHLAYNFGFPNITKWVNLVAQRERRLSHLHLRLDVDHHFHLDDDSYRKFPKLPTAILTCTTLVTLDLRRFSVKGFSFSSVGFGFPSLKTLSLQLIEFNEVQDFMLLLAGSPILEDLRLSSICMHSQEEGHSLTLQEFKRLSFPKLTKADIYQCSYSCYMVKAVSTSVSLCLDTSTLYHNKDYKVNQLQQCYDDIAVFHNLTHLELHNRWDLEEYSSKWNEEYCQHDWSDPWAEPEFVPQCLPSYLRTCNIKRFNGFHSDLMLAKYILKNANFLQTMTIWTIRQPSETARKLYPCPKASPTCQLLVH